MCGLVPISVCIAILAAKAMNIVVEGARWLQGIIGILERTIKE